MVTIHINKIQLIVGYWVVNKVYLLMNKLSQTRPLDLDRYTYYMDNKNKAYHLKTDILKTFVVFKELEKIAKVFKRLNINQ